MKGAVEKAEAIAAASPDCFILQQFQNPANPAVRAVCRGREAGEGEEECAAPEPTPPTQRCVWCGGREAGKGAGAGAWVPLPSLRRGRSGDGRGVGKGRGMCSSRTHPANPAVRAVQGRGEGGVCLCLRPPKTILSFLSAVTRCIPVIIVL